MNLRTRLLRIFADFGAFTTHELARMTSCHYGHVNRVLQGLHAAGRIVVTGVQYSANRPAKLWNIGSRRKVRA